MSCLVTHHLGICHGGHFQSRTWHSSQGSTDHHVQGLSLDHQFGLHFNDTIKSQTQGQSDPHLKHSIAYWTGPNHWLPLVVAVQQTRISNWQQQNYVLACEFHLFCSHWSIVVPSKRVGLTIFTAISCAFSVAVYLPESYWVWHWLHSWKFSFALLSSNN